MKRFADAAGDERATSPTIGAVLLVGVTVVLATTAGTGMFGLADQARQGAFATPSVDYQTADDRVTVTWLANADAEELRVTMLVGDQRRTATLNAVGDKAVIDGDGVTVSAGGVTEWDDPTIGDGDRVSVTVIAAKGGETMVVAERSGRV